MEKSGWRFASAAMRQQRRRPQPCKHCAVLARRRNCRGSSRVSRWDYLVREFFETRIATERVKRGINFDKRDGKLFVSVASFKPVYCLFLLIQATMNHSDGISENA